MNTEKNWPIALSVSIHSLVCRYWKSLCYETRDYYFNLSLFSNSETALDKKKVDERKRRKRSENTKDKYRRKSKFAYKIILHDYTYCLTFIYFYVLLMMIIIMNSPCGWHFDLCQKMCSYIHCCSLERLDVILGFLVTNILIKASNF